MVAVSLCLLIGNVALAGDDIYRAEDTDGVPRFSSQPYDESYVIYARLPRASSIQAEKVGRSALAERRAAMAPHILLAATRHGLSPNLLAAVAEVESGFNAKAISPRGAIGTMQLTPKTAAIYGVTNPFDAPQNIEGGTRYLKDLLAAHQGNLPLALAAYNAGNTNVLRHHQRIPPFHETMLYVPRVLAKMAEYQGNDGL